MLGSGKPYRGADSVKIDDCKCFIVALCTAVSPPGLSSSRVVLNYAELAIMEVIGGERGSVISAT